MNKKNNMICITSQNGLNIDFFLNGYYYGYDQFIVTDMVSNYTETYLITTPETSIVLPRESEYKFYLYNTKENIKSYRLTAYCLKENNTDILDKIIYDFEIDRTKLVQIINDLTNSNNVKSMLTRAIEIYNNDVYDNNKLNMFKLITGLCCYLNDKFSLLNKDNYCDVSISQDLRFQLDFKYDSEIIKLYNETRQAFKKTYYNKIESSIIPSINENSLYRIDIYTKDKRLSNIKYFYVPFEKDTIEYGFNKYFTENHAQYLSIIEEDIIIPSQLASYEQEYINAYLLMNNLLLKTHYKFNKPIITIDKHTVNINVSNCYDYISKTSNDTKYYLCILPVSNYTKYAYRNLIETPDMNVSKYYVYDDELYYCYIENEQKNIITDITLFSLSGKETEFNESYRQYLIQQVKDKTIKTIQTYYSSALNLFDLIFDISTSQSYDYLDIDKIIVENLTSNYYSAFADIIYMAHTDIQANVNKSIVVKYRKSTDTLLLQPEDTFKIMYKLSKFDINNQTVTTEYYHAKGNNSIDYRLDDKCVYLLECLDIVNNQGCGYLVIDARNRTVKVRKYNLEFQEVV